MLKVRIDEYGRLEVRVTGKDRKELHRQIRMANNPKVRDSEYDWGNMQNRWAESVCDKLAQQHNHFGLIVVKPEQIGAMVNDTDTLIVDTGWDGQEDFPEDDKLYERNKEWGFDVLRDEYYKRLWYDNSSSIRSWLDTLDYEGVFTFSLHFDVDVDLDTMYWPEFHPGDVIELNWEGEKIQAKVWSIGTNGHTIQASEITDEDRRPRSIGFNVHYVTGLRTISSVIESQTGS